MLLKALVLARRHGCPVVLGCTTSLARATKLYSRVDNSRVDPPEMILMSTALLFTWWTSAVALKQLYALKHTFERELLPEYFY